jgi:hypothetical protein
MGAPLLGSSGVFEIDPIFPGVIFTLAVSVGEMAELKTSNSVVDLGTL